MRRNLTLEDAGVLDLRKFINSNETWNAYINDRHIYIPVDWFISQGALAVSDISDVVRFLRPRFSTIIVSYWEIEYLATAGNYSEPVIASDWGYSLSLSCTGVSDGYVELTLEEL